MAEDLKAILDARKNSYKTMMQYSMNSLSPDALSNFNAITQKYPGMSNDLVISMVRQGLNADTPGINKIATIDGIAALKADAFNVDKIKKSVKPDRGFLGTIGAGLKEGIYDPFKGLTRTLFATLRLPYDMATVNLGRNPLALFRGEDISTKQYLLDQVPGVSDATTLGALIRNFSDQGSGFFVGPTSKAGKAQIKAMGKYGQINGESYTIGRHIFNGIGLSPEGNAYKTLSGIVDATLNVGLDPSVWLGPGAVTKVLTQGKKATTLANDLLDINVPGMKQATKEANEILLKEGKIVEDKITKKVSSPFKRLAKDVKKKEDEKIALEKQIVDKQISTVRKLLNFETNNAKRFEFSPADDVSKQALSARSISEWFVTNPKTQTGELSEAMSLLATDMKSTGGFFDGYILLDEVPQYGKVSAGAHYLDEYAVTLNDTSKLNLLDLADDFTKVDEKTRIAESLRRSKLADGLDKLGKNAADPEFRVYNELATRLRDEAASFDGFVGSLFAVGDELVAGKSLGTLLGEVAALKNPAVMSRVSDLVQDIWKVDGFTNVRSIYGGTGGVAITNTARIAATRAEIGIAAAEIADPTNLGPNVLKLLDSIKKPKDELARRQQELNDLSNKQLDLEDKEQWFRLLREKANGDPEILKELIADPKNKSLKGLLKLEAELVENNILRESILENVGLVDGFMGNVLDTPNVEKAIKFMLGRQFKAVAEIVAGEKDLSKLRNLFGRKLDDNVIKELALATTVDDVYKVLINQVNNGSDLIAVKKAVSTGAKIAANPVARIVPGVNLNAIRMSEKVHQAFGRFYMRTAAVNLSDLTSVNNVVEDWMSSILVSSRFGGMIISKKTRDRVIADTQKAVFAAETNAERAAAVHNGIGKLLDEVADSLGGDVKEGIAKLKESIKIAGADDVILSNYSLEQALANGGGGVIEAGGKTIRLTKGMLESQLAKSVLHLPDSRAVTKSIIDYKTNISLYGAARSTRVLLEEANDLWRTAQLVARFAYIMRNIGEMQMRQFLSGHNSLFNNPIGFIAMMIANPEGNWAQKALAKKSKLGVNAMGQFFKSTDAEIEFSDSVIAFKAITRRGKDSTADYGAPGRKPTSIFRTYNVVDSTSEDYLQGLAWTINNFSSDKFIPDVIRVSQIGTPEAQIQYVDDLIDTFDKPGNKLREFLSAIYNDNEAMNELLLINPFKETGPGVVKSNINKDNLLTYLFDAKQPNTVIGQVDLLAGQGAQRDLVLSILRDGEAKVPVGGKLVTIKPPYAQRGLTTDQVIVSEKNFGKQVAAIFKPDQMVGSRVRVYNEKAIFGGVTSSAKRFTNAFFGLAARMESKFNFGPEYQATYWDFVATYADMLSTDDLIKLRNNANKAFAPTSKGGKKIIGRVSGPLRVINNTLKQRLKNPSYVHRGGATLRTVDSLAAEQATKYVEELFYNAAKQKQWANAARIVAPFAQAHYNTIGKWGELMFANPAPAIKFAKAFDALTKEGSNVIYNITNVTYDDNQGFFYKDENSDNLKFKTPLVGSFIGALAGLSANINAKDALQITSPVESLNLAFGSVNPLSPGMGPTLVAGYTMSGRDKAFGPIDDLLRDIVTPFGEPKGIEDIIFPAWAKKITNAFFADNADTQRGVKDWASYLASTGDYGDNPFANDNARNQLFSDAEGIAKWANIFGAVYQSISPATPIQEILLSIKNPNNKQNFMTMTMLYEHWDKLKKRYPGDQTTAASKFAEKFGHNNILVAISNTTPGTSGTQDAWAFLNNNPDAVSKYATPSGDVIPYFFPGGEYAIKYTNWQKKIGARRQMSTSEIAQEAEGMVYAMLKGQLAEEQISGRYTDFWYNEQIAILNKQFGGARPVDAIVTGIQDEKIATIGRAIEDPIFKLSSVYEETVTFYKQFDEFRKALNDLKVSNYAELSSKGGVPTLMRNELVALGETLMSNNPEFSRMYYGVFAGILREAK